MHAHYISNCVILSTNRAKAVVANGIETEAVYKDGAVSTEVKVVDGSECKKPSLLKTLVRSFAPMFFIAMFFKLMHDILMFVSPQLLKWVTQFVAWAVTSEGS